MPGSGVKKEVHRRVWRVTANAPQGEYVDLDAPPARPTVVHFDRPEPGWLQSSFDLSTGLEVVDASDTVPAELFDELFRAGSR
jgi:hypothetical protein